MYNLFSFCVALYFSLNSSVKFESYHTALNSSNALDIIKQYPFGDWHLLVKHEFESFMKIFTSLSVVKVLLLILESSLQF